MSDEESKKTGSNHSGVLEESATNGRATVEQVHTVTSQPSDDLASLPEFRLALRDAGFHQEPTQAYGTHDVHIGLASAPVTSAFVPSATRHFRLSSFPIQATDEDDYGYDGYDVDLCVFANPRFRDEAHLRRPSSCALLISGRDVADVNLEQTCLMDVSSVHGTLGAPHGTIPENNIHEITPYKNHRERDIEKIYSQITTQRPRGLIIYYTGHGIDTRTNPRRLYVSDDQGNSLNVSRIRDFVGLLTYCSQVLVISDSCSSGDLDNLFLPMFPPKFMPERKHIQWCSCKRGGKSYLYAGFQSVFTSYVLSALAGAYECPNGDAHCPFCSTFRRSMGPDGHIALTSMDLMDYVHKHMKHSRNRLAEFDLPMFVINPESRDVRENG